MKSEELSTKQERKLQDRLNRVENLLPGLKRLWELDRIADEMRMGADFLEAIDRDPESIDSSRADALILERLAWDLIEMRKTLRPPKRGGRYDPGLWPRERP